MTIFAVRKPEASAESMRAPVHSVMLAVPLRQVVEGFKNLCKLEVGRRLIPKEAAALAHLNWASTAGVPGMPQVEELPAASEAQGPTPLSTTVGLCIVVVFPFPSWPYALTPLWESTVIL